MSTESSQLWRGRIVLLLAVGVVAAVVGLIAAGPRYEVAVLELDFLTDPEYEIQSPLQESGELLLRVRVDGGWQVYRYDVAQTKLVPQEPSQWHPDPSAAFVRAGEWTDNPVDEPVYISGGKLMIDPLRTGQRATTVALAGEFALSFSVDRSSGKCAVLTVDTRNMKSNSVLGSPQTGRYSAPHYIEMFRYPEMDSIRAAVRIPFTTAKGYPGIRWSRDGRYLVMRARNGRSLCVVDTEPPADSQDQAN